MTNHSPVLYTAGTRVYVKWPTGCPYLIDDNIHLSTIHGGVVLRSSIGEIFLLKIGSLSADTEEGRGLEFAAVAAAAAKSLQSCLTLCDPIDGRPPGSPVPGVLQPRTLEWVAISISNAWKWKVKVKSLSRVRPSATPWTAACQVPPSMWFSRQEYQSGSPVPSPHMGSNPTHRL